MTSVTNHRVDPVSDGHATVAISNRPCVPYHTGEIASPPGGIRSSEWFRITDGQIDESLYLGQYFRFLHRHIGLVLLPLTSDVSCLYAIDLNCLGAFEAVELMREV